MTRHDYHASNHFNVKQGRFFNPWADTDRSVRELLRWWATGTRGAWPPRIENSPYPPPPAVAPGEATITFVGHASVLIRLPGCTVLTDPHFSTHAGAFGRFGAIRVRPPGLTREALPPLDAVFVSHNHYDHLDAASLQWLDAHRAPLFVTCLGLKRTCERLGLRRVVELDWFDSTPVGDVSLTVVPAQHWSKRSLFDLRRTLWGGCVLAGPTHPTIYFAGDTGYGPFFTEIARRLGPPDVALLPIGAYEPRWFMRDAHMNPDDAVRAHLDLGARTSVPIHYGTFRLTDEAFDQPLRDLAQASAAHGLSSGAFRPLDVGESSTLIRSP